MSMMEEAKAINGELVSHRRYIHQNPETGLSLPNTSRYVIEQLTSLGYTPQVIGGHSVTATVGGKKPGKVFLLRADMDALPMAEQTGLPFASVNGSMHACGHDTHTSMLLGAAKLLKAREEEIHGTVKLFFQTAEETLEGAKEAISAGILENPKVDGALMLHIMSGVPFPEGSVAVVGPGASYASADWYRVDVTGKGGHGASPHDTVSAINILCAINTAIQEIMSVVVAPGDNCVMTVGQIHAGDTSNIIPETAFLSGTIRTFEEKVGVKIKEKLVQAAENIAAARGGKATVTFTNSAPALVSDEDVRQSVLATAKGMLPQGMVIDMGTVMGGAMSKLNGSEDFACICEKVPGTAALLGAGEPQNGYVHPGHNPKVDFNEDVFYIGSALYAQAALDWLADNR